MNIVKEVRGYEDDSGSIHTTKRLAKEANFIGYVKKRVESNVSKSILHSTPLYPIDVALFLIKNKEEIMASLKELEETE